MVDKEKVQSVINDDIKPALESHGGNIELIEVGDDGVVKVKLQGACRGCPGARMTLQMGVQRRLQEMIPEVKEVVAVDD